MRIKFGKFIFDENTSIKGNAQFAIEYLQDKIKSSVAIPLSVNKTTADNFIEIDINPLSGLKKEGYTVKLTHPNL